MSKRTTKELAAKLAGLADQLVGDDDSLSVDALAKQLRESGLEPDEVRKGFYEAASRVALRERSAGRPAPIGLQRAIEQTGPVGILPLAPKAAALKLGRWLGRFSAPFAIPEQLEALRAYRTSSDISPDEKADLDALEEGLKQRVKGTEGG